jgi:hypothetical protein
MTHITEAITAAGRTGFLATDQAATLTVKATLGGAR